MLRYERPSLGPLETEESDARSQANVVLVMALMDIDFANQYRQAAMSQISNEWEDVESADNFLTMGNETITS